MLAAAKIDVTTVVVSAVISAIVAAFVSWLFNFALGGWMEVRKRRAVRRDDVHADLEIAIRTILNAIRTVNAPGVAWRAEGDKVTGFEDGFDQAFAEMDASYKSIRAHLAGRENVDPERTIGWAINVAGNLTHRVKTFREGAIGHPPDGLAKERDAMAADLGAAKTILEMARDCLRATGLRRRQRRRRLWRHLESLADSETPFRTPMAYTSTLPLPPNLTRN